MSRFALARRVSLSLMVVVLLGAPTGASAAPVIFASQDNVLFRINGMTIDTFTLSDHVTGLDFDAGGNLWAIGLDAASPNGFQEVYRINDPFGTPTLQLVSDGLTRNTPSIEWVGNTLYAVQGENFDPPSMLVTLNPNTGAVTPVGATGQTGADPNHFQGITLVGPTMWAISTDNPGTLQTIDWNLSGGPDPTATFVAPMGTGFNTVTSGLDHDPETGDLWAMIRHGVSDEIGVFTIDEVTGNITEQYDLSALTLVRGASGIALIPEPATLVLLALGGVSLARRRRA